MTPYPTKEEEILFTRQRHEADRAGLHWDYRLVHGDKAYSWATKKQLPEPGKAILLFEQPVHDRSYALSQRVEIPKGEYGAGTTTLDFVRKAKLTPDGEGKMVLTTGSGERYLLKKMEDGKYGDKAWLFKNLTKIDMDNNKYLEKIALRYPEVPRHEFDMAFEGGGNPTRERIIAAARAKNQREYESDLDYWRDDLHYMSQHSPEAVTSHIADMPALHDYDHLGNIRTTHQDLASRSGMAVPGPSAPGLAIGYGLGAAGLAAGVFKKNMGLGLLGAGAALGTGLYHHMAQPEHRHNRYMNRLNALGKDKQELLDWSDQDGITRG